MAKTKIEIIKEHMRQEGRTTIGKSDHGTLVELYWKWHRQSGRKKAVYARHPLNAAHAMCQAIARSPDFKLLGYIRAIRRCALYELREDAK